MHKEASPQVFHNIFYNAVYYRILLQEQRPKQWTNPSETQTFGASLIRGGNLYLSDKR